MLAGAALLLCVSGESVSVSVPSSHHDSPHDATCQVDGIARGTDYAPHHVGWWKFAPAGEEACGVNEEECVSLSRIWLRGLTQLVAQRKRHYLRISLRYHGQS